MQLIPQICSSRSHAEYGTTTLQSCYTTCQLCQQLPGNDRGTNLVVTDLNTDSRNVRQHYGKRKMAVPNVHESESNKKKGDLFIRLSNMIMSTTFYTLLFAKLLCRIGWPLWWFNLTNSL